MKNKQLNTWLWRWHIISALLTLPVIIILNVTGIIYLYKDSFNDWSYQKERYLPVSEKKDIPLYSYQQQLNIVNRHSHPLSANRIVLNKKNNMATTFYLNTEGHARHAVYVDPHTLNIQGEYIQKQSLMYLIRKLHGELLSGLPGTLLVELTACWLIVMLLTGLYVWWPNNKWRLSGLFWVRTNSGTRVMWRDLHVVTGFYACLVILVILLGGLPWTEVFGSAYKAIQTQTQTGFPEGWRFPSTSKKNTIHQDAPLNLDQMVAIAESLNLPGEVVLKFDQPGNVFSVSNRSFYLSDQHQIHISSIDGQIIKHFKWDDVGIMMQARLFLMRFHQGEYGLWNWYLVLFASLLFLFSNIAGLVSYLKRKSKGSWSLPDNKKPLSPGYGVIALISALAIALPMFGASLLIIVLSKKTMHLFSKF